MQEPRNWLLYSKWHEQSFFSSGQKVFYFYTVLQEFGMSSKSPLLMQNLIIVVIEFHTQKKKKLQELPNQDVAPTAWWEFLVGPLAKGPLIATAVPRHFEFGPLQHHNTPASKARSMQTSKNKFGVGELNLSAESWPQFDGFWPWDESESGLKRGLLDPCLTLPCSLWRTVRTSRKYTTKHLQKCWSCSCGSSPSYYSPVTTVSNTSCKENDNSVLARAFFLPLFNKARKIERCAYNGKDNGKSSRKNVNFYRWTGAPIFHVNPWGLFWNLLIAETDFKCLLRH